MARFFAYLAGMGNPIPSATISGMGGFEDIAVFGREREDWLRGHIGAPTAWLQPTHAPGSSSLFSDYHKCGCLKKHIRMNFPDAC